MQHWRQRLENALTERDMDMKTASLRAGKSATFVRDLLRKGSSPSIDNLQRVADAIGISVNELVGSDRPYQSIAVSGVVAAGERWTPFDDGLGQLDLRIDEGEPVAVEVRGDSMSPVYRHGDIIAGPKAYGRQVENLIGRDCIVLTIDGEGYIKFVAKGRRYGQYVLKSYNPTFADSEDVRVEWAAPIQWVKRAL